MKLINLFSYSFQGAEDIFNHLIRSPSIAYPPERIASAMELIGTDVCTPRIITYIELYCFITVDNSNSEFHFTIIFAGTTFLDEHHDQQKALHYWRQACDLREQSGIVKELNTPNSSKLQLYYRSTQEFMNRDSLDAISHNVDDLRLQSLLICERVLRPSHKDMIYRLMYRGAAYADSLQYQHCIDLWRRALELRVEKDTILFCDTCFTAQALVKLFLDLHAKNRAGLISGQRVRVEDVISTIELLVSNLPESHNLLYILPQFERQLDSYNSILKIITHLLHLLTKIMPSSTQRTNDIYQATVENTAQGNKDTYDITMSFFEYGYAFLLST